MNAFAAALDAIFEDPNMGVEAWHQGGGGQYQRVRVIRSAPDAVSEFNGGRFVSDSVRLEVRIADLAEIAIGDRFLIGGETLEVISEPLRDAERLIWKVALRAL